MNRLRRIELRAPVDGYVHELVAHTVGGVISAGETVMVIVPDLDALIVEAAVPPDEIDRVHLNQPALIKFSAFNQRTTPELMGTVIHVAADASVNADTRLLSYSVRVALDDGERERLGSNILIPGMPAEVFIQTEPRQVLSYLIKPITDQLEKAFREE